jgi:hypothetical protein
MAGRAGAADAEARGCLTPGPRRAVNALWVRRTRAAERGAGTGDDPQKAPGSTDCLGLPRHQNEPRSGDRLEGDHPDSLSTGSSI